MYRGNESENFFTHGVGKPEKSSTNFFKNKYKEKKIERDSKKALEMTDEEVIKKLAEYILKEMELEGIETKEFFLVGAEGPDPAEDSWASVFLITHQLNKLGLIAEENSKDLDPYLYRWSKVSPKVNLWWNNPDEFINFDRKLLYLLKDELDSLEIINELVEDRSRFSESIYEYASYEKSFFIYLSESAQDYKIKQRKEKEEELEAEAERLRFNMQSEEGENYLDTKVDIDGQVTIEDFDYRDEDIDNDESIDILDVERIRGKCIHMSDEELMKRFARYLVEDMEKKGDSQREFFVFNERSLEEGAKEDKKLKDNRILSYNLRNIDKCYSSKDLYLYNWWLYSDNANLWYTSSLDADFIAYDRKLLSLLRIEINKLNIENEMIENDDDSLKEWFVTIDYFQSLMIYL